MPKKGMFVSLLIWLFVCSGFIFVKNKELLFDYPEYWPKPKYTFSKNTLTEEGFQLGRRLFYDPILSKDNTISCASCHLQATGFTHVDHDLSHGIKGRIGERNSLVLINLAWNTSFMWDGSINHIETQALAPIHDKNEMDETLENVIKKLEAATSYKKLFYKAFNDSTITGQRTLLAITQFVGMLNSYNSKYDKYIRNEVGGEFTGQEKNGESIFKKHCASCHKEPLFTNNQYKNTGLKIDETLNDFGRMKVTNLASDSLKFKVPTLRNIQFTMPYMHDGRFETLQEVIAHYTSDVQKSTTLATELEDKIVLTHKEKIDLLVFLRTLTDKEFLFNKRFSFPKSLLTTKNF